MVLPILCETMWLWKMSDQTECTVCSLTLSAFVRLCTDCVFCCVACASCWDCRQSTQCACSFRLCQTFHRLCVNSEPFAAMQLQTANAKFTFLFNSLCNSFDNLGFYLELQQKLKCLPSCLQNLYFYCVKYQSIWDTVKFVTVWCYLKIVQKYFKMAQFRAMFSMEFLCQVQGSSTKSEFSVPILILFCWLPKFATFGGKNVCNSEVRRPWCNLV